MTKNLKNSCRFRLGEVCKLTMGQSPSSIYYNDNGIGLPFLQGKSEFQDVYPKPIKYCTQNLKIVMDGTILLSVRAPVGDVNIADQKYVIGRGLTGLMPLNENELDRWYLFFHLKKAKNEFESKSSGSTFQSINKSIVENFTIPLPPISEQRAIVKVLRTMQDAIEVRKNELNLQRELKEALMAHLFTNGTKNEPLKETEIGLIPQSWSLSLLGEIVKLKSGETRPKILSEKATENYKVPVYGGNGITGYTSEVFTQKKLIVVGRVGEYCGCVHIADAPNWITDNALYSHEWFQEVDIEYFANLLSYLKLNRLRRKSGQPLITQGILSNLKIPLAGKNEQKQISEILKKQTNKINLLTKEIHLYQELFQAMLEELMTGKISTMPLIENCEVAS